MNVVSLFNGMNCAHIAFDNAGIKVDKLYSYEIDKHANAVAKHNFPNDVYLGDVFEADFTVYEGIDFVIGGSPCTFWSIAKGEGRETTASGMGWELFQQYVRAVHEAKPKWFIYENNKSMSKEIRASIDKAFGFEAVLINSALVSAQNRQRLYWVGKRNADGTYSKVNVEQPQDRGILLRDILESGTDLTQNEKSYALTTRCSGAIPSDTITRHRHTMVAEPVCVNSKMGRGGVDGLQPSLSDRIYDINGKATAVTTSFLPKIAEPVNTQPANRRLDRLGGLYEQDTRWGIWNTDGLSPTLTASMGMGGGHIPMVSERTEEIGNCTKNPTCKKQIYEVRNGLITINGKQYAIKLADGFYIIRKLTVTECMRFQTVPEWYDFSVISNSQAYKCLGNSWTCDVISHLINATQK